MKTTLLIIIVTYTVGLVLLSLLYGSTGYSERIIYDGSCTYKNIPGNSTEGSCIPGKVTLIKSL